VATAHAAGRGHLCVRLYLSHGALACCSGAPWRGRGRRSSGVLAGAGGNLVANRLQRWHDETDAARQLMAEVATEPALRAELDAVLEKLDAVTQARDALPEAERQWFTETLRTELTRLGNASPYTAQLTGSGAIAQGPGAVAAGQSGVAIGGSVHGNVSLGSDRERKS
jgi:hypothetical protein